VIGKRGRLEVPLWWSTTDDLDLVIGCPPAGMLDPFKLTSVRARRTTGTTFLGRIMGMGPGLCGDGIIDVDANRKRLHPINKPAQHAVWVRSAPMGDYTVAVRPWLLR
jgi:hypothetical protein